MDSANHFNYLISVLKDEVADPSARSRAAEALTAFGEQAVNPLLSVLHHHYPGIRFKAAEALGNIGDRRATDPLLFLLKDEEPSVQASAVIALGRIGDPKIIPILIDCFSWLPGSSYGVQAIMEVLVVYGKAAVQPCLEAFFQPNQRIRLRVTEALKSLKDESSIVPLLEALKSPDNVLREHAAEILGVFNDERVINALIDTLQNDRESLVRMAAADSLGRIGDHRAVEPLIQFLPPENQNASISIAPSCGRALAEIGDPRAVEPLIQALKCANKKDWRYYADALGITGDPRAIKPLAQALLRGDIEIRRHASRLLGEKFGEPAVPYLVRVLSHEDYTARILAAEALTKIDSPAARDALARSHNGKKILEPVKDTVIRIKAPKRKWWEFWKS